MKKYFEGAFVRFLSWPKTILFGNQFHVLNENGDYRIEKRPKSTAIFWLTGEPQKLKEIFSPSMVLKKLLAAVLYPFFNPIAFALRSMTMFATARGRKIKADDLDMRSQGYRRKEAIKQKIFHHGLSNTQQSAQSIISIFVEKDKAIQKRVTDLCYKINSAASWNDAAIRAEVDEVMQLTSDNFAVLLVAIQKIVLEQKLETVEDIAKHMVEQSGKHNSNIAFSFQYASLFSMYQTARNNLYYTEASPEMRQNGHSHTLNFIPSQKRHATASAFYTQGTMEYKWRQIYNTNVKQFYSLFGGEQLRKTLNGRDYEKGGDSRMVDRSRTDTSKDETSYYHKLA